MKRAPSDFPSNPLTRYLLRTLEILEAKDPSPKDAPKGPVLAWLEKRIDHPGPRGLLWIHADLWDYVVMTVIYTPLARLFTSSWPEAFLFILLALVLHAAIVFVILRSR